MEPKNKRKKKAPPSMPPLPAQAVSAYQESADPLGSYSGLTESGRCMPRKTVDGKIYLRVPEEKSTPVQDADDL